MKLGLYVHIPYCVQRCPYCDFTTFEKSQILEPKKYVSLILKEIELMHNHVPTKKIDTIFFGGGTPSLIDPVLINDIFEALKKHDFEISENCEITLEINPKTITQESLESYLSTGFNRFSVGAQSFNQKHLKTCGRIHTEKDTLDTLELLKSKNTNFSLDLLYALPQQKLEELKEDLKIIGEIDPPHISTYCLTVPTSNPLAKNRPPENEQINMSEEIHSFLNNRGYSQYEISNYAKPGYESVHNNIYWSGDHFLGLGVSAHSYFNSSFIRPNGLRFWNTKNLLDYEQSLSGAPKGAWNPADKEFFDFQGFELLNANESLTDYCHMRLRTMRGISRDSLKSLFPNKINEIESRFKKLEGSNLLNSESKNVTLTKKGKDLLNVVLQELTFT